jgi:hypothetical protein
VLVLASADWLTPVAALISGILGLAGVYLGTRTTKSQRDLARRERTYEDLRTAYNFALAAMTRLEHQIDRVYRGQDAVPDMPDLLQPETVAGVMTFGEEPVVAALTEANAAAEAFFAAARDGRDDLEVEHAAFKRAFERLGAAVRADLRDE